MTSRYCQASLHLSPGTSVKPYIMRDDVRLLMTRRYCQAPLDLSPWGGKPWLMMMWRRWWEEARERVYELERRIFVCFFWIFHHHVQEDAQKRKERGRSLPDFSLFFTRNFQKKSEKETPQKTHTFLFKKRESKANQQTPHKKTTQKSKHHQSDVCFFFF